MRTHRRHRAAYFAVALSILFLLRPACGFATDPASASMDRAVTFLSAEVPQWKHENHCYSCHNNGDAVRALVRAHQARKLAGLTPIDDTLKFLAAPTAWDANGPEGPFKDLKLQRIQFAAALAEARAARLIDNSAPLRKAAALLAEHQSPEGFWETDAPGTIGSPVTYGRVLATAVSLQALGSAGESFSKQAGKARRWLLQNEPKSVLDAAATLLGLQGDRSAAAEKRREQCLELIRAGQSSDGGWGPFVNSPPQVFDTAVVVLALSAPGDKSHATLVRRGREFLLAQQEPDGGWPATTRPSGVDSYAQRISTTGWALLALLAGE